ncbi:MAG: hypothetical protein BGN96_16180 [Bacteroidales bacterium 45-6]|nr:MAG: hypothetical protein BGN96_16180 [Bacteroidales bacterium 45-6]
MFCGKFWRKFQKKMLTSHVIEQAVKYDVIWFEKLQEMGKRISGKLVLRMLTLCFQQKSSRDSLC